MKDARLGSSHFAPIALPLLGLVALAAACSAPPSLDIPAEVINAGSIDAGAPTPPSTPPAPRPSTPSSTSTHAIGGIVTGLEGAGLVLTDNGGNAASPKADGAFAFTKKLAEGAAFEVAIAAQPTAPVQTCRVTGGTGHVAKGEVTGVRVSCATNTYALGGTVSGLTGSGLVLRSGAGSELTIDDDGAFTFPAAIASGASYAVTVETQPSSPAQTCSVAGGAGVVVAGDVASVAVSCSTDAFTVGGTVSGLDGTGLVLENEGGDDLAINANGDFAFATPLADLSGYAVTVLAQPAGKSQTCTVSSGSGNLAGGPVASVSVVCTTNTYAVGGAVSGLATGDTLVLQNEGADDLTLGADGTFSFASAVASGASYAVTVLTQPAGETCTVTNDSGVVTDASITDVTVTCAVVCPGAMSFDDGTLDGFTSLSDTTTLSVNASAAANGTSNGLQVSGESWHYAGALATFPASHPATLSWWEQLDATTYARGYVVLTDDSDNIVFFLLAYEGSWVMANQEETMLFSAVPGDWIHFELTFDWDQQTMDVKANGTSYATGLAFRDPAAVNASKLNLYNLIQPATTYYDEIQFACGN